MITGGESEIRYIIVHNLCYSIMSAHIYLDAT